MRLCPSAGLYAPVSHTSPVFPLVLEGEEEFDRKGARTCTDLDDVGGSHPIPQSNDVVCRPRSAIGKLGEHLVQVVVVDLLYLST
jgi:hypothetical protein